MSEPKVVHEFTEAVDASGDPVDHYVVCRGERYWIEQVQEDGEPHRVSVHGAYELARLAARVERLEGALRKLAGGGAAVPHEIEVLARAALEDR